MKLRNQIKIWILVAAVALLLSACSTDNKSGQGQDEATKPPPQVRVGTLPTLTPAPALPTDVAATSTVEPTAAQAFNNWTPPDVDTQANDIEADINEIERELNNQKFILKP